MSENFIRTILETYFGFFTTKSSLKLDFEHKFGGFLLIIQRNSDVLRNSLNEHWHDISSLTHYPEFFLLPDLNSSTYLPLRQAKTVFHTLFHFYPKPMRPISCMFPSRVTPFLNSQFNNSRSTKNFSLKAPKLSKSNGYFLIIY